MTAPDDLYCEPDPTGPTEHEAQIEMESRGEELAERGTADDGTYVRQYYRVPAHKGRLIRFEGVPGTIVGFDRQYLLADLDDGRKSAILHPKWHVEYLAQPDCCCSWVSARHRSPHPHRPDLDCPDRPAIANERG